MTANVAELHDRFWPAGVARSLGPLPRSLSEALRETAARRGDAMAIGFYGASLSYRVLLEQVERLAAFLQHACGVSKGDRVLLDMQNSPQFVIAFQAVVRAGAAVVPINPMSTAGELTYLAADSGARVAIVGAELLDRFAALMPEPLRHVIAAAYGDALPDTRQFRLPAVIDESRLPDRLPKGVVAWRDACAESRAPLPDATGPGDLCVMPYTSGTTGKPKACIHTHASVLHTAILQARWYGAEDGTVLTAFMPLFHVAGMQFSLNGGLASGAAMVIMTRWDRDLVPSLFKHYGVTMWSAAPTMVVDALAAPGFDASAFDGLKVVTGGGAKMPAAVAEELLRRWGLRYIEGYGMSETISPTHINPPDRPKPQCLGIPVHDTIARVVDPETLDEVETGAVGEIIVSGPQLMTGYWNRPDANAEVFLEREGRRFLRTGDLGRVDEDGYFHMVDRLKRMISVSGFKVWPAECEAVLYGHPAIQECCVIAAPDDHRGETVKALIVRRPGIELDADDLISWARERMAAYKAPRAVAFVDSLPRSASNKVDWRALQAIEWAAREQGDAAG